jgi:hypothetical protein
MKKTEATHRQKVPMYLSRDVEDRIPTKQAHFPTSRCLLHHFLHLLLLLDVDRVLRRAQKLALEEKGIEV